MNVGHYLLSALSRKEVYHFLDTHPWAYPLGALLVAWFAYRQYRRWSRWRRPRARSPVGGRSARRGGRPENVTELAKPTTAKNGHWEWVEDAGKVGSARRASGDR